jgi:hypothetical protein
VKLLFIFCSDNDFATSPLVTRVPSARNPREKYIEKGLTPVQPSSTPFQVPHLSQLVSVALPLLASFTCPLTPPPGIRKNVRHSSTKQFSRLQSFVFLFSFLFSPLSPFFLAYAARHIGPLTQNVKRSLNITNPNADPISYKIKTTAPKVRLFHHAEPISPLISFPSYTASGPTQERSSQVRQLKFKVQPPFCCLKRLAHRPA